MVFWASIAINVLVALLSILAWLWILLGAGDSGQLAQRGIGSLKYFTVLSNIFSAAVSATYLVVCVGGGVQPPLWLVVLKLVAAAAVMLTFLTTAILLMPLYGWKGLYVGGNLWLHLILPLFAAVDCCLFLPVSDVPLSLTPWAMVPVAAYGAFYLRQVLVHGAKENGVVYDFYGFLRWGRSKIPMVLAAMLLVTWGIALVLRALGGFVGLA